MGIKVVKKNEEIVIPPQREKINPMAVLKNRKSLTETIEKELEEKGVVFFRPEEMGGTLKLDSDYLSIPKDITEVESKQLGKHLNAFTQQRMYMRTLIGWQELYLEDHKREYYSVSNTKYQELCASKMSETAKERILNNDPEIQPVFFEYKDCKKKLLLLQYNLMSIEDSIFLLSREVSRRTGDFDNHNRNESVQGIRRK